MRGIVIILMVLGICINNTYCSPGDTIHVQTFTYGAPQDAWFVFPSAGKRYSKILMNYKLRCPYNNKCGEWDKITNTYLYERTRRYDSTLYYAPSFKVNGLSPDSIQFMMTPSWTYFPVYDYPVTHTDTVSYKTATIGDGANQSSQPFFTSKPVSRTLYLWKASELTTAGLTAGDITGIRFNVLKKGSDIKWLKIKLMNTEIDSLSRSVDASPNTGQDFTEVYEGFMSFVSGKWNSIQFIRKFAWDGTSNILSEITYDNNKAGTENIIKGDSTRWSSGVYSAGNDKSLFFKDIKYVAVPGGAFAKIDTFLTISFWQYGNPAIQPQNNSILAGTDATGNRVLNIHLPWSDRNIYWDAGNAGNTYDRINKGANDRDFEGRWNYWTFTKNARTGTMKIYKNGSLFLAGTGKTKLMKGIKNFAIGAYSDGTSNYDGYIDEFAIWNAELDSNTIKGWMYRDLSKAHPYNKNLMVYYKFNESTYISTPDSSGNGFNGLLSGPPESINIKSDSLFRNFTETRVRPQVVFEQGVFTTKTDTVMKTDSISKPPFQVIVYNNFTKPTTPTDTIIGWPTYYNHYIFNKKGKATDSASVKADTVIYLKKTAYYGKPFEIVNRYEIGRYITPYGNGLNLGNGFTWVYDVSDYAMLLHDSVHLTAGNGQELLDMSFDMIEGTPPRDPISITNLWCGSSYYGTTPSIEAFLTAKRIKIPSEAKNSKLRLRVTGHGFGGTDNCAEFCSKYYKLFVNGTEQYSRNIWKNDCALNPLYPQGGTWVYSRANWCPGDDVPNYDIELTPNVTPGDTATLDFNVEPYTWNGTGTRPNHVIETQLIGYSAPNFTDDAGIYDIISPNTKNQYLRMNPICSNPVVIIQNTGSNPLKSLLITYGVEGAEPSTYQWTGNLAFTDTLSVKLGYFAYAGKSNVFRASVSKPNGKEDEYALNNTMASKFSTPPKFPSDLIIEFFTNNYGDENSYVLKDQNGNIITSKSGFQSNKLNKETVHLADGCYEFILNDLGDDGIDWWANEAGTGYFRFRNAKNNVVVKNYGGDFGRQIYQQFYVGTSLDVREELSEKWGFDIYPNPGKGKFNLSFIMQGKGDVVLNVVDILGKTVYKKEWRQISEKDEVVDLGGLNAGIYYAIISTGGITEAKKVMVTK